MHAMCEFFIFIFFYKKKNYILKQKRERKHFVFIKKKWTGVIGANTCLYNGRQ